MKGLGPSMPSVAFSMSRCDASDSTVTIAGNNGLDKNSLGTLIIAAPATYTGGTTISQGTLALGVDNALSSTDSKPIRLRTRAPAFTGVMKRTRSRP